MQRLITMLHTPQGQGYPHRGLNNRRLPDTMSTNEKTDTTDEAGSADEFDTSRQAEIESLAASA